ncbi:hypothetical protein DAEQUDRAFT_271575 [Daedalea quercina L-15889]|uniref:Uncharacterized protein n=1 Tax=Daedalea quercina L-15889 TaxID=1314783 RepID=A0A165QCS0_9APHY|nr:hypothetical protein DAEQUDRAFT_271575 [Daedalea quercina L-15889]
MHTGHFAVSVEQDTSCTGCLACAPYEDPRYTWTIRPLRRFKPGADGVDWNDCYWGYRHYNRYKRRSIVRPLPRNITDRLPQELIEHIIDSCRWQILDLYNFALVCRAWHHHSQALLYSRVFIGDPGGYNAIRRCFRDSQRSRYLLAFTRILWMARSPLPGATTLRQAGRYSVQDIPLVFGGSMRDLQCLMLSNVLYPPYHRTFFTFMSRFTEVVHLNLSHFALCSFEDLRRIICSLLKLRELELWEGELTCASGTPVNAASTLEWCHDTPRLCTLCIWELDPRLLSLLASWISLTNIHKHVTTLHVKVGTADGNRSSVGSIIEATSPSLKDLDYTVLPSAQEGQSLSPLAYCARLLKAKLAMRINPMDSWRGIVAALYDTLSQLSSGRMHTFQLELSLIQQSLLDGPDTSQHSDSEFVDIDLGPIRQIIARLLFNSLRDARIDVVRLHRAPALTSDASLTADEVERRVRLILQPWDTRGILAVTYEDRTIRSKLDPDDGEQEAEEETDEDTEDSQWSEDNNEDTVTRVRRTGAGASCDIYIRS